MSGHLMSNSFRRARFGFLLFRVDIIFLSQVSNNK